MAEPRQTPPMGSETKFAKAIGEIVAREMRKANPKTEGIPAHRWAQKVTRFIQRLGFIGFAFITVKLEWPVTLQVGACILALRAVSPDLADGSLKWLLSFAKQALAIKNSQGKDQ